jgi:hypothetical protein
MQSHCIVKNITFVKNLKNNQNGYWSESKLISFITKLPLTRPALLSCPATGNYYYYA